LKGFGSFLVEADVAEDLAFEIGDRSEDAPIDYIALELTDQLSTWLSHEE
jgi:hypothetical protein